jgi:hypothetical protein
MRHRAGGERNLDTCRGKALTGLVYIRDADGQMTKGAAQVIRLS